MPRLYQTANSAISGRNLDQDIEGQPAPDDNLLDVADDGAHGVECCEQIRRDARLVRPVNPNEHGA